MRPVPPVDDPSLWRPGIADITAIQAADLIVLNGAGLATWTTQVSLPRARTEAEPAPEAFEGLEAFGLITVACPPSANRPVSGDFQSVMRASLNDLRRALDAATAN